MARRCSALRHTVIVIPCVLLSISLVLNGCSSHSGNTASQSVAAIQSAPYYKSEEMETDKVAAGAMAASDNGLTAYAEEPPAASKPEDYADIPKKIIKEATIRYTTGDFKRAHKELTAIIARFGGEIISEQESRSEVAQQTQMEIRVPSVKFDSCLNSLASADETLLEKNITSKDVTEEYVDVSARMKARKEIEQRYLDILKQAKNVEDVLKVEEQLKTIREEVEAAQGRLQYIDHNVSMSLIHLSFYQAFSNTTPQGPGFFSRIFFSVKDGWNSILTALISFTALWPVWMVTFVLFIVIRRYRKRRRLAKAVA